MRRTSFIYVVSSVLVIAATAFAAPPADVRPNDQPFVPSGGYLKAAQELQLQRRAAIANRNLAEAARSTMRGRRQIPVILLEFSEGGHPYDAAKYQAVLFDDVTNSAPASTRPTLTHYYYDISNHNLLVTGQTFGWYKLPKKDTYYENGHNGTGKPFGDLLEFALTKADADTDFGQFDNDGPDGVPNSGDDDGRVDTVFLIQPETGGECHNSNIWSHSWHYSSADYGHSGPFVTNDLRHNSSGQPVLGPNGEPEHITIDDYTIQPALACPDGGGQKMVQIGVFCHEYGHALGLPDLYDRTPTPPANPDSEGIGEWCIMAAGSYGGDGNSHAERPVEMCAWSKAFLGWANIQSLSFSALLNIEPAEERNTIYRLDVPGSNGNEYFLIEFRCNAWTDPFGERLNWDADLPMSGLAIWHVDDNIGRRLAGGGLNPVWPFSAYDAGQNDAPSLPNKPKHSLVSLLQPDRKMELERFRNRGDGGDLFVNGQKWDDDQQMICGSRAYNNAATGMMLDQIQLNNHGGTVNLAMSGGGNAGPAAPAAMLAAAPMMAPPPADQRGDAEIAAENKIRSISDKIMRGTPDQVTDEEKAVLKNSSEATIEQALPAEQKPALRALRSKELTTRVSSETPAETPAQQKIADWLKESDSKEAVVQFKCSDCVERVTGLDIPKAKETIAQDAAFRAENDLPAMLGPQVKLAAVKEQGRAPAST